MVSASEAGTLKGNNMSDYDFSDLGPKPEKEESEVIRPNFKVSMCCGNCKFYWYYKGNQRRGNCKLPNPNEKKINKSKRESYYNKDTRDRWDKVHITNVCDFHQLRSVKGNIHSVGEYCGVKFQADGTLLENED